MSRHWTARDIPDQRGRIAVVTGANTGLGFDVAKGLAEAGAKVVLAVRDPAKGRVSADRIRQAAPGADLAVQHLDLASLEAIATAAEELRADYGAIDLLINNAGVMYTPKQTTADGFELQFGTNHLGHFAFTGLLLDRLMPVPDSRVVSVASLAHNVRAGIDFADLQWETRSYDRIAAYGQSKLANLMFAYELQRRLAGKARTISVAAHPGVAKTDLTRNAPASWRVVIAVLSPFIFQSSEAGSLPILRAATDADVTGGQYYGPDSRNEHRGHAVLVRSNEKSRDLDAQSRLWTVSEELTGVKFPV